MSTREERRQARVARLLEQMQATAETWARAEYDAGVQDGRGIAAAPTEARRATAERRFRERLAHIGPPLPPGPSPSRATATSARRRRERRKRPPPMCHSP